MKNSLENPGTIKRTRIQKLIRSFFRIPPLVIICFGVLLLTILIALVYPLFPQYDPYSQSLLLRFQPPRIMDSSSTYMFGTDQMGRDYVSRVVLGLRVSLTIGIAGVIVGLVMGVLLGLISGMARGIVDNIIMFLVDAQLSVPVTLIAIMIVVLVDANILVLVVTLGFTTWNTYARLVRGQVLSVREMEYVEAARALGVSSIRIGIRHILPNVISPIIVLSTFNLCQIILIESSLSFMGVGLQPPDVSLGLLISVGRDHLLTSSWMAIIPSVVLALITLAASLIGDWLRDILDPQLQRT